MADEMPPWEDVADNFAREFPNVAPHVARSLYEQARAHRQYATQDEPASEHIIRMLPGAATYHGLRVHHDYQTARRRIAQGNPLPPSEGATPLGNYMGDYNMVAAYHRTQEINQARAADNSWGGHAVSAGIALESVPAMIGEALAGGTVLRGLGLAAPAAAAGSQAPSALAAARTAITSPSAWGRNAAQTALMPSMWAPQWTEANIHAGRDAFDPRALPSAYAMGFLNTAVLGSLGQAGNAITTPGVRGAALRVLTRTGTGMLEQQGADIIASAVSEFLPEVYRLQTGYGILGHVLRGEGDQALRHGLTQAVTFGAFSVMHGFQDPHQAKKTLSEVLTEIKDAKLSAPEAGKALERFVAEHVKQHDEALHQPAQGPEPVIDRPIEQPISQQPQKAPEAPLPEPNATNGQIPTVAAQEAGTGPKVGVPGPSVPPTDPAVRQMAIDMVRSKVGFGKQTGKKEAAKAVDELLATKHYDSPLEVLADLNAKTKEPIVVPIGKEGTPEAWAEAPRGEVETLPYESALAVQMLRADKKKRMPNDKAEERVARVVAEAEGPLTAKEIVDRAKVEPGLEKAPQVESRVLPEKVPETAAKPGEMAPGLRPDIDPKVREAWDRVNDPTSEWNSKEPLKEVFDAASLTKQARDVVSNYLRGMTMEEIAAKIGVTKQRVGQIMAGEPAKGQKGALEKLGLTMEAFDRMHEEAKQSRLIDDIASGRQNVLPTEMHVDPAEVETKIVKATDAKDVAYDYFKELSDQMEKEIDNGKFTDKRAEWYAKEIERVNAGGPPPAKVQEGNARSKKRRVQPESVPQTSLPEPQGQPASTAPGPLAGNQGQDRGTPPAWPSGALGAAEPGRVAAETPPLVETEGRMPEGMGAAGVGQQATDPPASAKGTSAPMVPEPPPHAPESAVRGWVNWLKSFANQTFPGTTAVNQKVGEKLASAANAPNTAKSTWDYVSKILKVGSKTLGEMTVEERRLIGTTWLERRMREYRDTLSTEVESLRKEALAAHKLSATSPEAIAAAEKYADAKAEMESVGTLVGQQGSPLRTEADYQAAYEGMWSFWQAVRQEWTPLVDKNFRGVMGLEPTESINTKSQIPGLPLNAIPIKEGDNPTGYIGTGKRQGLENLALKRPGFTRKAELNSPAYDVDIGHMMQKTLNDGIQASRRADFVREAIDSGVIAIVKGGERAPEGWQYLALDPAKGLPDLPKDARYYAHPEAFAEIKQGLGIGDRPGQALASGIRPVMDKAYSVALMSPVELATHIGNHMTALFRPGMGVPLVNLKDTFSNAWHIWKGDPAMHEKVMKLAEISASFSHDAKAGILGESLQKYDPTAYLNKFTSSLIDTMQKAVRIQLGEAHDSLVRSGHFEAGETNKRDFINQALGNYNTRANNVATQFLKDSGLQSFATAAHTFTVQGAKTALGSAINAPATTYAKAAELRAIAIVKLLPFLAMGPVINSILWKQAFPANVPAFAIKTRDDSDGASHYFDQLAFTGLRRGWKITGQNATIDAMTGANPYQTPTQIANQTVREARFSLMHLVEGPPVAFLHTLATGENTFGHRLTPRRTESGEQTFELWQNAKAAGLNLNPLIGSLTEADRPKTPTGWMGRVMPSFGPFGERRRPIR